MKSSGLSVEAAPLFLLPHFHLLFTLADTHSVPTPWPTLADTHSVPAAWPAHNRQPDFAVRRVNPVFDDQDRLTVKRVP